MNKLSWDQAEDIALALKKQFPQQDPLRLSFPSLHKMIVELPGFGDNPQASTETILEAIQMKWYEEIQ